LTLATIAAASGEEIVPFDIVRAQQPVFRALVEARSRYGGSKPAVVDGDALTGFVAAFHRIKKSLQDFRSGGIELVFIDDSRPQLSGARGAADRRPGPPGR